MVDDLDGTEVQNGDGQTVSFSLDGKSYELDLTHEHAEELRAAFSRYAVGADRRRPSAAQPLHYSRTIQPNRCRRGLPRLRLTRSGRWSQTA